MNGGDTLLQVTVASVLACLACGLGALPLLIPGIDVSRRLHLGYAFAGGMMVAASVFNLVAPGLETRELRTTLMLFLGIAAGCGLIAWSEFHFSQERFAKSNFWGIGSKRMLIIFLGMTIHSIPEGVAVGGSFASGVEGLGILVAVAIGIHNIPEGLAIAIPCRAEGGSIGKAFLLATLSSATQPLAAVPAVLLVRQFHAMLVPCLGFGAGAMLYLVLLEVIPEALAGGRPRQFAAAFMSGFCALLMVQAAF